jgi:uncharacterized protein YdbL (DUF1318 family)
MTEEEIKDEIIESVEPTLTITFNLNDLAGIYFLADMGISKLTIQHSKDRLEISELENRYLTSMHGLRDTNINSVLDKIEEVRVQLYDEIMKSKDTIDTTETIEGEETD